MRYTGSKPGKGLAVRAGRWLSALGLAWGLVGCGVSPKPDPPDVAFEFDPERTTFNEPDAPHSPERPVELVGGPGAASPPGAIIRLYPLGSDLPRAEAEVGMDGSFLMPEVLGGQEVRIQILHGTERSEPVDLWLDPDTAHPAPVTRAFADCLVLDPDKELELRSTHSVVVSNGCGDRVTLDAPVLRRAVSGIDLGTNQSWPVTLSPGGEIEIRVEPTAELDADEEIFFIEATAPETERWPITFRAP